MSDSDMCFRKNVVYEITCKRCLQNYIGSTIRELHERINEHMKLATSSMRKHLQRCQGQLKEYNISVKILAHDNDTVNLRLKEAIQIKNKQPCINSREECTELLDILF